MLFFQINNYSTFYATFIQIDRAVEYLIETVYNNPGEISLLAIAPLTNLATAMMLDPDFADNLKELIIMGGTFAFPVF